jgi:hypothetical protein
MKYRFSKKYQVFYIEYIVIEKHHNLLRVETADRTTTERDWGCASGRPIIAFRLVRWCGDCGRPMWKYDETGMVWGFLLAEEE